MMALLQYGRLIFLMNELGEMLATAWRQLQLNPLYGEFKLVRLVVFGPGGKAVSEFGGTL